MGVRVRGDMSGLLLIYACVAFAVVVAAQVIYFVLRRGLAKTSPGMGEPGPFGRKHGRYVLRAMLGVHPVPQGYLRTLVNVLWILYVVGLLGFFGWTYLVQSDGCASDVVSACHWDPREKTPGFWFANALLFFVVVAYHLGNLMGLRADPRVVETSDRFDARGAMLALRMILRDGLLDDDPVVRRLRDACRCFVLLALLDALAWIAYRAVQ